VKNEEGETVKIPGTLKSVKAIGVYLERFKIAQVSINLVDLETTSMHNAYEEVKRQANLLGLNVTGSELVGLTPLEAMLKAGKYYSNEKTLSEQELVSIAIEKLGLSQLEPFSANKKIIEYMI
jgi:glutamate formiminotransferase/formiminotetrahydrofolate cyclodeaminase